jgi:hypothetical protein
MLIDVHGLRGQERVGLRLGPVGGEDSGEAECGHRGVDGPAVRGGARHAAEGDGEGRGDEKNGEHLQEVRERRGVLERMRAVGVEEATTVGAEHLDGLLRGDRALRDGLGSDGLGAHLAIYACGGYRLRLDEFGDVVRTEVLDDSL